MPHRWGHLRLGGEAQEEGQCQEGAGALEALWSCPEALEAGAPASAEAERGLAIKLLEDGAAVDVDTTRGDHHVRVGVVGRRDLAELLEGPVEERLLVGTGQEDVRQGGQRVVGLPVLDGPDIRKLPLHRGLHVLLAAVHGDARCLDVLLVDHLALADVGELTHNLVDVQGIATLPVQPYEAVDAGLHHHSAGRPLAACGTHVERRGRRAETAVGDLVVVAEGVDPEVHAADAAEEAGLPVPGVEDALLREHHGVAHGEEERGVERGEGNDEQRARDREARKEPGHDALTTERTLHLLHEVALGRAHQHEKQHQEAQYVRGEEQKRDLWHLGPAREHLLVIADAQALPRHVHFGRDGTLLHQLLAAEELLPIVLVVAKREVADVTEVRVLLGVQVVVALGPPQAWFVVAVGPLLRGRFRDVRAGRRGGPEAHGEDPLEEVQRQGLREREVGELRAEARAFAETHVDVVAVLLPVQGSRGRAEGEGHSAQVREDAHCRLEELQGVAQLGLGRAVGAAAAARHFATGGEAAVEDVVLVVGVIEPVHLEAEAAEAGVLALLVGPVGAGRKATVLRALRAGPLAELLHVRDLLHPLRRRHDVREDGI
mmetsp:Transcript_61189/g.197132  ORF Transcript_61189/g.197132 Transcript_61189/m.197132 type:complete len:603 (-) Transcript_61189:66-1874(-)